MMIRTVSVLALAAVLGACTTTAAGDGPRPLTPTARYALEARPAMQEVALAPRADGLSTAQRTALGDLASRANGKPIVVRAPSGGDPVATRSASNARTALEEMGAEVRMGAYEGAPGAPILVGYNAYQAVVPQCGNWTNLTATRDNAGYGNFGCAVTANMAAQIANPADIVSPQPMDPTDAARRSTIIGKYRAGEVTSAQTNNDSSGAVSRVVP
jgi:pilus assembly protein CpaD